MFLCVISRIRERTEGYADVEVGEDELDTGFWSVRTLLGQVAMTIRCICLLIE